MDALRVNIFAGPGTGKSTTRALVFGTLKQRDHKVEESPEYAKDLTWEKRYGALGFQPFYKPSPVPKWYPEFEDAVIAYFKAQRSLNFFLERDPQRGYKAEGRRQSEESAKEIDTRIKSLLTGLAIPFQRVQMDRFNLHISEIVNAVETELDQPATTANTPETKPAVLCTMCGSTTRTRCGRLGCV